MNEEARLRRIEEERLGIRAICSTLVAAFGVDVAIGALNDERRELLQMKSESPTAISEEFERAVTSSGTLN